MPEKKKILLLGIVHSAQSAELLKLHIKLLKERKFSKDFIKKDTKRILDLRKMMLNHLKKFNPEIIAEESGPWITQPGDRLKKIIGDKKTVIERLYGNKHFFVDAQMDKSGQKPIPKIREKEIANQVLKKLKEEKQITRMAIVVGASHVENIDNILKKREISLKTINLKKRFKFPR